MLCTQALQVIGIGPKIFFTVTVLEISCNSYFPILLQIEGIVSFVCMFPCIPFWFILVLELICL